MNTVQNTQETKEKKTGAKKVLGIIANVLIWIFIVFAVIVTVLAFAAQSSPDGIPSIGGYSILTVQTDSMSPTFNSGDIIIGRKLTNDELNKLQVGDVITYKAGDLNGDGVADLNSHRIVEIQYDADGNVSSYITKGDNPQILATDSPVAWQFVMCKYEGTRIPVLGSVLAFLQQPTGFLVVIVLPLVIFFLFELISFIRKFIEVRNGGAKKITAADEELIRQRAIEEYIKAQQMRDQAEKEKVEQTVQNVQTEVVKTAETAEQTVEQSVQDVKEEIAQTVEQPVQEAKEEITQTAEAVEKEVKETVGEVSEKVDAVTEVVEQKVTETAETISEKTEEVSEQVAQVKEDVDQAVQTTEETVTQAVEDISEAGEQVKQATEQAAQVIDGETK